MVADVAVALVGERPLFEAALKAGGLGFHLAEGGAGVGGLALGFAALLLGGFEGDGELVDVALNGGDLDIGLRKLLLDLIELLLDLAELALEGEWAVSASGATKPSRSFGRMTSSERPKPSKTRTQSLSETTPGMLRVAVLVCPSAKGKLA